MEPTKAKLARPRPSYKAMWQQEVKREEQDLRAYQERFDRLIADRDEAEGPIRAAIIERDRWATAAVIEALVLFIVAIILLAR